MLSITLLCIIYIRRKKGVRTAHPKLPIEFDIRFPQKPSYILSFWGIYFSVLK